MAKVVIELSFRETDGPRVHHAAYRWILRALALWNYLMLPNWRWPPLYSGRVRYGVPRQQEFLDAFAIVERGWSDCGPLSAYRVAELWRAGERGPYAWAPWVGGADFRIYCRPLDRLTRRRLYHAQVRRANQEIEDPSRLLGMPSGGALVEDVA